MDNYWAAYFITPRNIMNLTVAVVKNSFNIFVLPLVMLGVLAAGTVAACVRDRKIAVITITAVLLTGKNAFIFNAAFNNPCVRSL